ncbi:ABC transporter permease [Candidatus Poriferisodalis sp.]|uniref:ABC transporter permease n=1 Tax=Candidatus Poriferisodalis sp. TaxID=3101277 RepID=UPI003B026935
MSAPTGSPTPIEDGDPVAEPDGPEFARQRLRRWLGAAAVPVVSVALGLALGALLIAVQGHSVVNAYGALIAGGAGDADALLRTLHKATPLIFGGLAVAFAFKAGLFNIGGQGQLLVGAAFAAAVGFGLEGLPTAVHLPLALAAGAAAGAVWGAVAGVLKATSGAHEVIVTIMLNFVAGNLTDWLAANPWRDQSGSNIIARTPPIQPSAELPAWGWLPAGFVLAVIAAFACWFAVERTTYGFEVRSVGANRHAARYAGMSVGWIMASSMAVAGLLAGIGGAVESLGVDGRFEAGFNVGLGFEGITIALLARTNPIAVIPAGLLVGLMQAGAAKMQFESGVAPEIIDVIQALILLFVAAPLIVRWMLRLRAGDDRRLTLGAGWGR